MHSEPNGTFFQLWLDTFKTDFRPKAWAYNGGVVPCPIYNEHRDLLHVE